ncbi:MULTISPECIES: adenylyl cyclase [Micromonospora]|uniref:Adenylyl cyclase n=1 Tax=Micromonospora solifontis TaxID=2487138 RepID=A0ABX9WE92_9ACTN|nr:MULTISPECIES: adenylyl cyclase [Micromonospora]NES16569.1 adenylyl cyclase [Micromonospora sp. PPF5-17B]NES37605.1 adenylyl cyclase [Micromonospora solifontis]NES58507.1 adenylyl cyclase [Micromonospora sp. PPF5-6]RNL98139.1 adenylyl cyclase [Micromonospora solifontis]
MRPLDPSRRRFLTVTAASAASLTALGLPTLPAAAAPAAGDRAAEPDFGPNVFVYDPTTPVEEIQSTLDRLFAAQEHNEMGADRYAVLFKPGRYQVNARLGYYTTVAGLGAHPDDVEIHGAVRVIGQPDPNSPAGISALTNFWRSAENLAVTPTDWSNQWAVSQASPMRRVHIKGILWLEPGNGGYSSGGYIADSKVDGITINGSQQQWLTRDSELGGDWTNGVWNQVFSGVLGAPAQGFPNPPYTTLPTSPVTREKPYLFVDAAGGWRVAVPALRHDTAGTTWAAGARPVPSLPLADFFVARPTDSAKRINQELSRGRHLLLTPGVYHLDRALRVKHPDTVVLGLGMPSLAPTTGDAALRIEDVDGVRIAGVLVDAGPVESEVLVEVGKPHSHRPHAGNPISLQDVFFRIGGPTVGRARTSLVVNSRHTLIDNIWAWRGDHGRPGTIGWTVNTADTGVVVNADDVTAYGLFVEHYQRWQTVWRGERGRTVFYQSELPYDPPSQAAWRSPTGNGWASYQVAGHVRKHEAWGLGVYSYFNQGVDIRCDRAIEAPRRAGVRFHDAITVFLDGSGGIERTINEAGTPVVGSYGTSPVINYP